MCCTVCVSDNLSGQCWGVNESAALSARTVVNNASESDDMVQLLHGGKNMTEDMVRPLYRFKANNINMSDSDQQYDYQLVLGNTSAYLCGTSSLHQKQVQGEAGGKSSTET